MRLTLTLVLLLASAAAVEAAPDRGGSPPSASILLHPHPRAWQPPVGMTAPGLRITLEPETGAIAVPPAAQPRAAADAAATRRRALDQVAVMSRADGSRFAVLGGLVRAYEVVSIGPDGALVQECVHSPERALEIISAPATRPPVRETRGGAGHSGRVQGGLTMRARWMVPLLALALGLAARDSQAAFVIVNLNAPGEGFNDPTPVAPVGGNPGTTVGAQRLNVFTKAGEIWDAILGSPVPIRVRASFDTLPCGVTSGVLGSAGPFSVESDFVGAQYPATWYVTAEANRLTGTDLEPTYDDMEAQFNSIVGTATCLTSRSWYYGYDGNEGANGIDLLPVLLHEFAHGLGFLTLTDETTGNYFASRPSIFDRYLLDNVTGKHWIEMTPTERVTSALNTTHLVWDGPAVRLAAPGFLGKRAHVVTSGALTGDFIAGQGVFSPTITVGGTTGNVVLVNDGVGTLSDGCNTPFVNAGAIAGQIALMDRSASCSFAQQSLDAQNAGAIAALIVNNAAGPEPPLRGSAPTVSIPVASLSQTDGNAIRAALLSGSVQATIALDPAHLAGADDVGRVMMYAPNPGQPGSSVSHWDVAAFPNLLMEPSINPDLSQNVDLTFQAFYDIGWFPQLTSVATVADPSLAFSHGPNPSRDGGVLRFQLPEARRVELTLFDIGGRRIVRLADGMMTAGAHAIPWDRRDDAGHRVGPGVYLARLRSGDVQRTLHVVLLD